MIPRPASAVMEALCPPGTHHMDMPLTPNRVRQAIREARQRR
jgi:hypothetical protein